MYPYVETNIVNKSIVINSFSNLAWCNLTCPNFCQRINNRYECNCASRPGYQRSTSGQGCTGEWTWLSYFDHIFLSNRIECSIGNYGYNCTSTCGCRFGTCISNATTVGQSCRCNTGYQGIFCDTLINQCGKIVTNYTSVLDALTFKL